MSTGTVLRLRPLQERDEAQARSAHAELAADGFDFLLDWDDGEPWASYVRLLQQRRRGVDLPPGRVPGTFLVAEVRSELVGRASIRHELNAQLAMVGGHIGYGVRPLHRGRGHATEILRQALILVRAEGVERVLLTCQDDNAASAAVIERHGGVRDTEHVDQAGRRTRRYWIE